MPLKNNNGKFFSVSNLNDKEGEIKVYGEITKWAWQEYGETNALIFNEELKQLKNVEKIKLRINSPGGSVFEAQTMYNSLKQFAKDNEIEVESFIEGVAASAATFLALVGDTVKMGEGCLFMIHNPSTYSSGMSDDLRKAADLLDKVKETILDIYMKKSSLTREELSQKMDDETWFSAKEALEAGFIDSIETFDDVQNNITSILDCKCLETYKHLERITNSIPTVLKNSVENKEPEGGKKVMPKNLQELKDQYKNLMEEHEQEVLKNAAGSEYIKNLIQDAINNERERIEALSKVKTFNKKQEEAVKNAMFKEPKDSKELIVEFYNSDAYKANEEIENVEKEKEAVGLNNIKEETPVNDKELDDSIINAALDEFNKN